MLIIFIGVFAPIKAQASVTEEDPLPDETLTKGYISCVEDFTAIRTLGSVKDSYFILTEDITISENWNPISDFKGTFDGCGHTITFNISHTTGAIPQTPYLGLFASCTDATIKNLYVQGNIELNTQGSYFNPNVYAGGIVASSTNSTLTNVHFSGNINILTSNDNSSWVGGLVGQASNTQIALSSCNATIMTKANSYVGSTKVGGLCGEFSGKIENCYNAGNIQAMVATDSPYAGGIVGNNKGIITKTYCSGKVKAEGPDINMSKVYAGGIVAFGEKGSSVTNCAVMSPEINITTGWINSGDKYIISNGGNKSNNVAINDISGSPTNDANTRLSLDMLISSLPSFGFDFTNTWTTRVDTNGGLPYLSRNSYIKSAEDVIVPLGFSMLIDRHLISTENLIQTDDGFTLCTKPINQIFSEMGVKQEIKDNKGGSLDLELLDDWYLFNIDSNYSILKMRPYTGSDGKGLGTAIPFMDFDINIICNYHNDLQVGITNSPHETDLYNDLKRLTQGLVQPDYSYCVPIAKYFADTSKKGSHVIAEEYIKIILAQDCSEEGYIVLPPDLSQEQCFFLTKLPDGMYDNLESRIKVNKYNLSNLEKRAIMVCRTGNKSINNYAAENYWHATATEILGIFLQGPEEIESVTLQGLEVNRDMAHGLYQSAIKSDAGVGEERFGKDWFLFDDVADKYKANLGDV